MTASGDDRTLTAPHRPPAAPTQWATVTRLGGGAAEPSPVPVATPPRIDGTLALQEPAPGSAPGQAPGAPRTPELRLLDGGRQNDEVRLWAARFAQAVVEVLGGDRPLVQLVRWTSHRVYVDLERRLTVLARTSDTGRRRRTVRPQVRSVHVFHPTPEAAEISVHVRYGQRSRAIAARLELSGGRWQCTALQLG
jgi:hypothetical protein